MDVVLRREEGDVIVLWISGLLRKAEFDAVIRAEAAQWSPGTRVKVLVLADDFQGWEQSEEWGDVSFFFEYCDRIERIAIVAEPRWETEMLLFAGAGLRSAPVRFFPSGQAAAARAWLKGSEA
jgi:hypothetical protein